MRVYSLSILIPAPSHVDSNLLARLNGVVPALLPTSRRSRRRDAVRASYDASQVLLSFSSFRSSSGRLTHRAKASHFLCTRPRFGSTTRRSQPVRNVRQRHCNLCRRSTKHLHASSSKFILFTYYYLFFVEFFVKDNVFNAAVNNCFFTVFIIAIAHRRSFKCFRVVF